MNPAERDGEFVADFTRKRAPLRKLEMVRIRWAAAADEAGLGADELQVITVPHSQRLADRGYRVLGCWVGWSALGRSVFALCGARRPVMAVRLQGGSIRRGWGR